MRRIKAIIHIHWVRFALWAGERPAAFRLWLLNSAHSVGVHLQRWALHQSMKWNVEYIGTIRPPERNPRSTTRFTRSSRRGR